MVQEKEYKICKIIEDICKEHGIKYTSTRLSWVDRDVMVLSDIYMALKIIIGKLKDIEERHDIDGLGVLLQDDILELEKIDHSIINSALKLKLKRTRDQ